MRCRIQDATWSARSESKVEGLCIRVDAKMANHTLRIPFRQHFGIDVFTFEHTPVQPFVHLT